MEGENKMMNSSTEPTSENHSSVSFERDNNLIIMNKGMNAACHILGNGVVGETRVEESGRERLKRHREEVMGKVTIPKKWGKEKLLKDWVDYTTFEALFPPHTSIITARDALIADGRKPSSQRLRIHTTC